MAQQPLAFPDGPERPPHELESEHEEEKPGPRRHDEDAHSERFLSTATRLPATGVGQLQRGGHEAAGTRRSGQTGRTDIGPVREMLSGHDIHFASPAPPEGE